MRVRRRKVAGTVYSPVQDFDAGKHGLRKAPAVLRLAVCAGVDELLNTGAELQDTYMAASRVRNALHQSSKQKYNVISMGACSWAGAGAGAQDNYPQQHDLARAVDYSRML